ncbi:MAG: hypothetical protein ACLR53_11260 [Evtepia gabavorous]
MLKPMGARQYLAGLWRMAALSNCFCGPGRPRQRHPRPGKVQARELRDRMEAQIAPAAQELAGILVRTTSR